MRLILKSDKEEIVMDKYMPIFEAFVGFLKTLLGNVLKDKFDISDYEPSIKGIIDAAKAAFAD